MVITYSTPNKKIVKVDKKTIGHFEGNAFIKPVIGSKHRLRKPPAWAIDAEAFDTEIKPSASEIVIQDKETDTEYRCTVETFDRLKGTLDRGYGRQYFLPMKNWGDRNNGHGQLSLFDWESNRE